MAYALFIACIAIDFLEPFFECFSASVDPHAQESPGLVREFYWKPDRLCVLQTPRHECVNDCIRVLFHCLAGCLYLEPLALIPLPLGICDDFLEDGHYGRWACSAGWVLH